MNSFTKQSITELSAKAAIDAARGAASRLGLAVSVAVCDESGILKAFSRMDGAPLLTVGAAQDKAFTAVGFGMASHEWYPMIKDDPALLHGVVGAMDRLVIFGGGIPIKIGDDLLGGVGVSGGSHEQDREIAEAASRSLEN